MIQSRVEVDRVGSGWKWKWECHEELEKRVSRGDIYPLAGAVGKAVLDGRWGYRTRLSGTFGIVCLFSHDCPIRRIPGENHDLKA